MRIQARPPDHDALALIAFVVTGGQAHPDPDARTRPIGVPAGGAAG